MLVVPASKPSGLGLPLSCRASSRTECGSLESGACEARSPKGQQPPAAVASEDAGREASQAGQGWQPLQVPRIRFRCTWRILLWQDSLLWCIPRNRFWCTWRNLLRQVSQSWCTLLWRFCNTWRNLLQPKKRSAAGAFDEPMVQRGRPKRKNGKMGFRGEPGFR